MVARSWTELCKLFKIDFFRNVGFWNGLLPAFLHIFYNRTSPETFLFWFRIAQMYKCNRILRIIANLHLRHISRIRNIDIPIDTKIGKGLYLGHFMCIVINPSSIIGDYCNISQFCNIGANDGPAAYIGNYVYIGPNVCIVENVKIGDNVTIGAGAVVVHDIPDNATVAGVPAKVLNYTNPGRYIIRCCID